MHALLYRDPGSLASDYLDRLALRLGLEVYQFQADLTGGRHAEVVARHAEGGRRSGVRGTPAFFLNGRRLGPGRADAPDAAAGGVGRTPNRVMRRNLASERPLHAMIG